MKPFFYLVMQIVDLKEQVVDLQDELYQLKTLMKPVPMAPRE